MTTAATAGETRARAGEDVVAAVRAFNRFYTRLIGVLDEGWARTPYTLTEARVLFELAHRDATEVVDLRRALGIDAGYLSRILARFSADGLVARERSAADARRQVIRLTPAGRATFATLDQRAATDIRELVGRASAEEQRRLLDAIATIREILAGEPRPGALVLREPAPGDLGWVVERNAAIYTAEYGWDDTYEAFVARIVADFVEHRDPRRERAWIAELDGQRVGCVFCVRESETVARLRLLLVEPSARGLGIGGRLVDECLAFARSAGYAEMVLWTNDVLAAARRIYQRAGFELVESAPHHSFGHDLVGQTWRRAL